MLEMLKVIHLGVIAPLLKINSYIPKTLRWLLLNLLLNKKSNLILLN